uniref:Uncharacterized protein n=1 Tax=Oncorhynchus kisutch TaxID=8019 RepID=A0A8C7KR12_ONCKI
SLCILLVAGHTTQTGVPNAMLSGIGENQILDSWWETQQLCSEVYLVTNIAGDMFCADQNFDITQVVPFFSSKHGELAIYYEQEEGEKSSSRGIVGVCTETHWITRFLEKSQEGVTALRLASVMFYSTSPDRTFSRFWVSKDCENGNVWYCLSNQLATNTALTKQNFTLKYDTNIPCQVVMSATLKSLKFYNISESLRRITCYSGTDELFLTVYEGLVYMDFSKQLMDEQGYGISNMIMKRDTSVLFVFRPSFFSGEAEVVKAMKSFAEAIFCSHRKPLILERSLSYWSVYTEDCLGPGNLKMVQMARQSGSAAKLPSSGGAVVGLYLDQGRLMRKAFCVIVPYNLSGTIATNSQV